MASFTHPITVLILILTASLTGQSTVTSPPGFDTREGLGYAYEFGAYADGRTSIQDGEYRTRPMSMKAIAFRLDATKYWTANGMGRSWQSVSLNMSECDIQAFQRTFSRMPTTTPKQVFSSPLSWPNLVGAPSQAPAPWLLGFPFLSPWAYSGRQDINAYFDFNGGTLLNGGNWSNGRVTFYDLDSANNTSPAATGMTVTYGRGGYNAGGCVDQSSGSNSGAYGTFSCVTFGPSYLTASLRGKSRVYVSSNHTAPGKPVAFAIGLAGGGSGVVFPGITCNRLYVDTSKPTIYFRLTASNSSYPTASVYFPPVPFQKNMVAMPMFMQFAWDDSVSGRPKLSQAIMSMIPPLPPKLPNRVCYHARTNVGYGGEPSNYYWQLPLLRYSF